MNKVKQAEISIKRYDMLQDLGNVQVDINRAVWAGNLTKIKPGMSFSNEKERNEYLVHCLRSASETITKVLKRIDDSLCCFCKKRPIHENYLLCKKCIDNYNREKAATLF